MGENPELVENQLKNLPYTVIESLDKRDALRVKGILEKRGATVELREK